MVGKVAKGRLVAVVVFEEMLEEFVLPHCKSVNELEYLATCLATL